MRTPKVGHKHSATARTTSLLFHYYANASGVSLQSARKKSAVIWVFVHIFLTDYLTFFTCIMMQTFLAHTVRTVYLHTASNLLDLN